MFAQKYCQAKTSTNYLKINGMQKKSWELTLATLKVTFFNST